MTNTPNTDGLEAQAAVKQGAGEAAALWRRGIRGAIQALDRTIVSKWQHSKRRQWRDAGIEMGMVLQVLHDEAARHSPATWDEANALDDALTDALAPLVGSSPAALSAQSGAGETGLRERIARAFDKRWPFYLPGPRNIDGHRTSHALDWDGAPAYHQQECYERADVALAALASSPDNQEEGR